MALQPAPHHTHNPSAHNVAKPAGEARKTLLNKKARGTAATYGVAAGRGWSGRGPEPPKSVISAGFYNIFGGSVRILENMRWSCEIS